MSKFSKLLTPFSILLLAGFCSAQQPTAKAQPRPPRPAAAGRATRATLVAVVPHSRSCPVKVNFNGTITTNGPAEVKYTWVSFDGGTWPEHTIKFAKAGTEKVSEEREVSQTGTGWMRLKVIAPDTLMSSVARYRVSCPAPKGKQ